jgi:hypothetical protein
MKTGVLGSVVGAVMVCGALVAAGPAGAALTVSGTGDGGGCSLRATIEDVNNGTAGGCGSLDGNKTTIEVPAGDYLLTGGELVVKAGANVVLVGSDPANPAATTIDGHETSRVLEVASGAGATLDGIEVTGGATLHGTDSGVPDGGGGTGGDGGGILNKGSLTLEAVLITGNRTGRGGNGGGGTIANTTARNGGGGGKGGNGGAIDNEAGASLVVSDSTIAGNRTGDGGAGGNGGHGQGGLGNIPAGGPGGNGGRSGDGGGIYNAGTATIVDSTVSGNQTGRDGPGGDGAQGADAGEFGAGKGGEGGAGGNSGLLYSETTDNPRYVEYGGGGGIDNLGALTMSDSTISANNTGAGGLGGGGGIGGERTAPGGLETGGKAGVGGGAGLGGGLLSIGSSASLTNVTISGNFTGDGGNGGAGAQSNSLGGGAGGWGGYGGGISAYGPGKAGLQLSFVTISGNTVGAAGEGGADSTSPGFHGGPGAGGGIATGPAYGSGGGVTLANSIVAGNGGANCNQFAPGGVLDGGHDVTFGDSTCPGTVANPLLGGLAKNGGPTETMLPGTGSAAIGVVPSGSCSPYVDQRGDSRPGSGKSTCDAGAVETGGAGGGPGETGGGGGGGGSEPGGGELSGGGGTGGAASTSSAAGSSSGAGSSGGGSPTGGSGSKSAPAPTAGKAKVGAPRVKGTSVSVPISCAGPKGVTCTVKVSLSTKGSKTVTVGSASTKVPGGETKTVMVSLDGAGKGALAKAHSLKATLTVDEIGRTKPVSVRTVTFTEG